MQVLRIPLAYVMLALPCPAFHSLLRPAKGLALQSGQVMVQVGSSCLVDLTATEEACSHASIQAVVFGNRPTGAISLHGDAGVSPDLLLVRPPPPPPPSLTSVTKYHQCWGSC